MQPDSEGYHRLALAVVLQAVMDASKGDMDAQHWLYSVGAEWLLVVGLEVTHKQIRTATREPITKRGIQKKFER